MRVLTDLWTFMPRSITRRYTFRPFLRFQLTTSIINDAARCHSKDFHSSYKAPIDWYEGTRAAVSRSSPNTYRPGTLDAIGREQGVARLRGRLYVVHDVALRMVLNLGIERSGRGPGLVSYAGAAVSARKNY